jgi:hypothetical protein
MFNTDDLIMLKQYDPISFVCRMVNDDGSRYDLTDAPMVADVKSAAGEVVDQLQVTVVNAAAGEFVLASTKGRLDVGRYSVDILFDCGDDRYKSSDDAFYFQIMRAVTAPRPIG